MRLFVIRVAACVFTAAALSVCHAWERLTLSAVHDLPDNAVALEFFEGHREQLHKIIIPQCVVEPRLHALVLLRQQVFYRSQNHPGLLMTFDDSTQSLTDVTHLLASRGLADAPGRFSKDERLSVTVTKAKRLRVGAWGSCASAPSPSTPRQKVRGEKLASILNDSYWRKVADETGVAVQLLYAIALRESGLNGQAHPWTINHRGAARYFRSKAEAVAEAKRLIELGDEWFDVGYMQVHWRFHKARFTSVDDAFEPKTNIRTGARILMEEFARTGSVANAVARYHRGGAGLDERGRAYVAGVTSNLMKITKLIEQS